MMLTMLSAWCCCYCEVTPRKPMVRCSLVYKREITPISASFPFSSPMIDNLCLWWQLSKVLSSAKTARFNICDNPSVTPQAPPPGLSIILAPPLTSPIIHPKSIIGWSAVIITTTQYAWPLVAWGLSITLGCLGLKLDLNGRELRGLYRPKEPPCAGSKRRARLASIWVACRPCSEEQRQWFWSIQWENAGFIRVGQQDDNSS